MCLNLLYKSISVLYLCSTAWYFQCDKMFAFSLVLYISSGFIKITPLFQSIFSLLKLQPLRVKNLFFIACIQAFACIQIEFLVLNLRSSFQNVLLLLYFFHSILSSLPKQCHYRF